MSFVYTTAIDKIRRMTKRIRVIPGGSSAIYPLVKVVAGGDQAGKTFGILPILIDVAINRPNTEISVVSESIPHLRKGALKDFLKIMKVTGRYVDAHYNRTLLTYTFSNGSYIEFFSADEESRVRGPRRNVLYINECNNLSFETYHQLAIRTSDEIFLDYNPAQSFWVDEELIGDEDVEMLTLTYKDNEALPENIVKELEKAKKKAFIDETLPENKLFKEDNIKNPYWANWCKVYLFGLTGNLEGVIYPDWKKIKQIPDEARLLGYAIDFGWSNPAGVVALYKWNDAIIWDEILYETNLGNREMAGKCKDYGIASYQVGWADSAEPKSIKELKLAGLNVKPVKKTGDAIDFGIKTINQYEMYITERSVNLIKEIRGYVWDKKTGKPVKADDHLMDAMRYAALGCLEVKKKFGVA